MLFTEFYFRSVSNSEGRETRVSEADASFPAIFHRKLFKKLLRTITEWYITGILRSVTAKRDCQLRLVVLYSVRFARELETRRIVSRYPTIEFSWSYTSSFCSTIFHSGERSFLENQVESCVFPPFEHTGRRSSYKVSTARLSFNPTRWLVSAIANLRNGSIDQSPEGYSAEGRPWAFMRGH